MLRQYIQVTEEEVDKAMRLYDKNHDGYISLSEFRQAVFESRDVLFYNCNIET